jgi:TM2 domain-containing membrane protein YozV
MGTGMVGRGKDKLTAALLALFLGFLGVHHFYLGSTTAGIVIILANCLCVGGLIALVEAIMLFTMSDADFDAKYNQRTPEGMEFVWTKIK